MKYNQTWNLCKQREVFYSPSLFFILRILLRMLSGQSKILSGGLGCSIECSMFFGKFSFYQNAQILKFFKFSILRINAMATFLSSLEKHVCLILEHGA